MSDLKNQLIRLGYDKPELRSNLRPILDFVSRKSSTPVDGRLFFAVLIFEREGEASHYGLPVDVQDAEMVFQRVPGIEKVAQTDDRTVVHFWSDDPEFSYSKDKVQTVFNSVLDLSPLERIADNPLYVRPYKTGSSGLDAGTMMVTLKDIVEEEVSKAEFERALRETSHDVVNPEYKNFQVESVQSSSSGGTEITMTWEENFGSPTRWRGFVNGTSNLSIAETTEVLGGGEFEFYKVKHSEARGSYPYRTARGLFPTS